MRKTVGTYSRQAGRPKVTPSPPSLVIIRPLANSPDDAAEVPEFRGTGNARRIGVLRHHAREVPDPPMQFCKLHFQVKKITDWALLHL